MTGRPIDWTVTEWDRIPREWSGVRLPNRLPEEDSPERAWLPLSMHLIEDRGVAQQPVFDPALAHYSPAMRPSEPSFADPETAECWRAARREALDTVLNAVAQSDWAQHLVLRGVVPLRAWHGEDAREPHELEFVVRPATRWTNDACTVRMLDDLAAAAERLSGPVRILAEGAVTDDLWMDNTRLPGRRLVLPWTAPGVPGGTVRLDFAFGERLLDNRTLDDDRFVAARLVGGPQCGPLPDVTGPLATATPALSLAWKILWLVTDARPQGHDLYDAVLLARTVQVPYELLREVFVRTYKGWAGCPLMPGHIAELDVDWEEFHKDYPDLVPCGDDFHSALGDLLEGTFGGHDDYTRRAAWLGPLVESMRPVLAENGMQRVQLLLAGRGMTMENILVTTRELLGCDLAKAHQAVHTHRGHSDFRTSELRAAAERFAVVLGEPAAAL
ncbi:nucleotidyl transferase AbiEii/AbiGii toxin family protein [Kitasatospora sp. NPDC004669]|uniref:nucleotidyl transferase AbiEii/AbiGii toxin family protein n=1 Tax=Kitasatospora sp. NPDC004669 TaxID=3154555 RepID=UPI0033B88C9B